jgi:hypothetical protein
MRYKKMIQEILGTELEKQGFTYMPNSSWSYERVKDQVWQSVSVVRERYCKGYIRMVFMTNAYGQKPKGLDDFVPGQLPEYWHYETEEELREIIEQFREWTLTYGLDMLEKMSVPTTEARPKPETNRYLYEHHRELYEEYKEKLCKGSDSWEAVVKAVQDKIEETWDEPFSEVEEMLIGLAALYAYALNEGEEGEWKWHDKANVCILDNLRGTFVQIFPLLDIITAWKGKNLSILSNRQENILIYYNKYVRKAL